VFTAIRTHKLAILLTQPLGLTMACFFVWQALRTLPYLDTFGVDALRDGATWGYSLFAWVIAALVLALPKLPETGLRRYPSFGTVFMFAGPAAVLATRYLPEYLPAWPGTAVTIPFVKYGDLCTHMAGACAFVLAGLNRAKSWWLFPGLCGFLIGITGSRGGGIAFLGALAVVAFLRFRPQKLIALATAVGIVGAAFCALDLHVPIPGTSREISSEQIVYNLASISPNSTGEGELEATRRWRLEWWNRILEYTLHGPYFWTGKGYGINLTIDDGIQTSPDGPQPLRSPHNSHLTFLARSGVPGFVLWSLVQLIWATLVLRAYFRARSVGWVRWSALFLWLLAYWTAFMINAAFDVSFEGPMSGIPFWTVFGFGWGTQVLLNHKFRNRVPVTTQETCLPRINQPIFSA